MLCRHLCARLRQAHLIADARPARADYWALAYDLEFEDIFEGDALSLDRWLPYTSRTGATESALLRGTSSAAASFDCYSRQTNSRGVQSSTTRCGSHRCRLGPSPARSVAPSANTPSPKRHTRVHTMAAASVRRRVLLSRHAQIDLPRNPMPVLELTRTPNDRRLYSLSGIGTVRLEGLFSNSATVEEGTHSWHLNRRGFWQRVIEATDASGASAGQFVPRDIRRGGTLRWEVASSRCAQSARYASATYSASATSSSSMARAGAADWSRSPSRHPTRSSRGCFSSLHSSSTVSPSTPPTRRVRRLPSPGSSSGG